MEGYITIATLFQEQIIADPFPGPNLLFLRVVSGMIQESFI